jgi:hypothetical protein
MKSCSKILVCGVFQPWIVSRWLWQVAQKLQNEHFDHCCIYLIILQMINKCPIFKLYMELYIYIFQFSSLYKWAQIQIW